MLDPVRPHGRRDLPTEAFFAARSIGVGHMRKTGRSRRVRDRLTAVVAAIGVASLAAGFVVMGTATTAQAEGDNVWVCKYTGKPVGGETASHVVPQSAVQLGEWFTDGQRWSIAVMVVTEPGNQVEKDVAFALCPTVVDPVAPYASGEDCGEDGALIIPEQPEGVVVNQTPEGTGPGTYTITFLADAGYVLPPETLTTYTVVVNEAIPYQSTDPGAACYVPSQSHQVTAVDPTVVQSTRCDVEGSYTIPATEGVQYLLDDAAFAAGTYSGPKSGEITAEALQGYKLTNPDFSFALNIAPAADCPPPPPPTVDLCSNLDGNQATVPEGYERDAQTNVCTQIPVPDEATAVEPTAKQSEECEVEGTYSIPATAGVLYLLDGEPLTAGTYDGPVEGVVTAVELEGYVLTNPDFEYQLLVEAAEACPAEVLPTEAVDVCPNLPGDQEAVPNGYEMEDGRCVRTEQAQPKPPAERPAEVLGTEAAVPTEVDAGLVGPTDTPGGSRSPLGQALMAAGLMLLVIAGTMQAGRRERGVHEA